MRPTAPRWRAWTVAILLGIGFSWLLLRPQGMEAYEAPAPDLLDHPALAEVVPLVLRGAASLDDGIPLLAPFDGAGPPCGYGAPTAGVFYCAEDESLQVDVDLMGDLVEAPDLARAYVVAHGLAHHLQEAQGVGARVRGARARVSPVAGNDLSVRNELHADCIAGAILHRAGFSGADAEAVLARVGDAGEERVRRGGRAVPETWTHGAPVDRLHWLQRGLEAGDLAACDPFDIAPR